MNIKELEIDLNELDALNLECYESLAEEYGDLTHETCRDFDAGTEFFLKNALKLVKFKTGLKYLDVGVGTGVTLRFMLPLLEELQANIEVIDISNKMLEITKSKYGKRISKYHHVSIYGFNPSIKYNLILAGLCDPYLTKETITILSNLLTDDGVLIFTLPTDVWAEKVRRKEHIFKTIFHSKDGSEYVSFSFCWNHIALIQYVESCGLHNYYSEIILIDEIRKIKEKISQLNLKLLLNERKIPMLLGLMFVKDESIIKHPKDDVIIDLL